MVTDGDIRRGLLNDLALVDPVVKVMRTNPTTAVEGSSREELIGLMEKLDILSVPLLDLSGRIIGLETLHGVLHQPTLQNPVFIMAGGFGTRLKPLTDTCPKPMLHIGNKPILETVIRSFIKAGFVNFYISTHYMPEQIQAHFGDGSEMGVNVTYVHEEQPLGTGGALGLLPKDLPKNLPLIMMNGDVLTKVDFQRLLDFHVDNGADATMCVREYDYQIPYGVINGEGNKITSMVEKPVQRFFVNAGIYVVSPEVIASVPKNHRVDMPTLLEEHMNERDNVLMFPIHEYWLDIGRMDDFNRAQADIHTLGLD
ncbi:mannose-1-phosphate guanylyltransferase [Agarivorans sp. Toyoura001]|nr:mannose-1-phosphate guanylyltransferase [Agarivorans sp. Toyoura001]